MSEIWIPRAEDQQPVLDFIQDRDRAAVWAGTGAGKTAIALTWLDQRMNFDLCTARALVVCPPLVVEGWIEQMARWSQFTELGQDVRVLSSEDFGLTRSQAAKTKNELVLGDKAATRKHLLGMLERLTLCPWSMWPFIREALATWFPYNDVVFDESSNLRDGQSDRGRAARWVAHKLVPARGVLELSATPAANHEEAVYAQVAVLDRMLLGETLTEFRDVYCVPDSRNYQTGQIYSYKIDEKMRAEFERRVATVAVSVPSSLATPLLKVEQRVALPQAAQAAYDALERDLVLPGITCGSAAVLHSKLRQMASGIVYRDDESAQAVHDAKYLRLDALAQAIDGPVLVGYHWTSQMSKLREMFGAKDIREPGAKAAFLAGRLKMLAVQPQSAAHGVDGLQAVCCNLVWLDVPEDLELEMQLNGRLHRVGTTAPTVMAHYLIAEGTIERDIYDLVLPRKMSLQELLLRRTRVGNLREAVA